MAAGDHLSDQFQVIAPHRAVKIGEKMYPASHTDEEFQSASIPMDNGHLAHVMPEVGNDNKPTGRFHIGIPRVGSNEYGFTRARTVDNVDELHKSLNTLSKIDLPDDAKAHFAKMVNFQRTKMID